MERSHHSGGLKGTLNDILSFVIFEMSLMTNQWVWEPPYFSQPISEPFPAARAPAQPGIHGSFAMMKYKVQQP